jgi:hypothetical protein
MVGRHGLLGVDGRTRAQYAITGGPEGHGPGLNETGPWIIADGPRYLIVGGARTRGRSTGAAASAAAAAAAASAAAAAAAASASTTTSLLLVARF